MAKNYIIDKNINLNFYEELYKSLDATVQEDSSQELCLISNMPLTTNFVELECKHKFNYLPLYHDILAHKKLFNRLEHRVLKSQEIRCPYCRNVQKTLLPYYNIPGVKLEHGVNYLDESLLNPKECFEFIKGKCAFISTVTENVNNVKIVTENPCGVTLVLLLEKNGKTYCLKHTSMMIKKLAKEEKQNEKDAAKQQAKEAKLKAKQEANMAAAAEGLLCVQILKSGPRKGDTCGVKVFDNQLCKRHFHLLQK